MLGAITEIAHRPEWMSDNDAHSAMIPTLHHLSVFLGFSTPSSGQLMFLGLLTSLGILAVVPSHGLDVVDLTHTATRDHNG